MKIENALYLIPVPIGASVGRSLPQENIEIAKQIRFFIVESRKEAVRALLSFGVDVSKCEFFELNEHTPLEEDLSPMVAPILRGNAVGVLSDAGCPAVGDPGNRAVALAHQKNIRVIPLVGPNSMILALMSSGLNGQNFCFNGYLPVKPHERESKIRQIESRALKENQTQIFIETPYRNAKMFDSILKSCRAETRLCVAAGITSEREQIQTKTISEWKKSAMPKFEKIPAIFLIGK